MTDLDVLQYFRNTFNVGAVRGPYLDKRKKKDGSDMKLQYRFEIGSKAGVAKILTAMLPHLCQRRAEHAEKVLNEITN